MYYILKIYFPLHRSSETSISLTIELPLMLDEPRESMWQHGSIEWQDWAIVLSQTTGPPCLGHYIFVQAQLQYFIDESEFLC